MGTLPQETLEIIPNFLTGPGVKVKCVIVPPRDQ